MGSFEFEYGAKWKALYDMKKQKLESLEREMKLEEDNLHYIKSTSAKPLKNKGIFSHSLGKYI